MDIHETHIESEREKDAINFMLWAIDEPPVSTLEDDLNADVIKAKAILRDASQRIQAQGWSFNTEEDTLLTPDVFSHKIPYLKEYLKMLASGGATTYVNIGGFVYDMSTRTNKFMSPISVDLIILRSLDEMPYCIYDLIKIRAALLFNMSTTESVSADSKLKEMERDALYTCKEYEIDFAKPNMLQGDVYISTLLNR